jgi:predicted nucleic acid-binding protein
VTEQTYLLDTSFWIRAYRRRPVPAIDDRFRELVAANTAAVNEIVRLEILVGVRSSQEMDEVQDALGGLITLPLDPATWAAAAHLGFELRPRGVVTSLPDLIIAASAITKGCTLLHADRDFDRIAEHSPLRVESYADTAI